MQRIGTHTCQIHSDGLSQRDSEISSEHRGTSERGHDSFLPPILRVSALLPGPYGNENFCQGCSKKKKEKKREKSLLSHGLCECTHRQLVTGIRAYRQKHLCIRVLWIFLLSFLSFCFSITRSFVVFQGKWGLMNQHQLESNYLKIFCQSSTLFLGLKLQIVLLGGNTDFWIVLILKHFNFFVFLNFFLTDMYIILLTLSVLVLVRFRTWISAVPAITTAWVRLSCKSVLCSVFMFGCSSTGVTFFFFLFFWSSELFFYMLILYQIVLMWYCSRCMYTCSCVHAFFYFFSFLFNLLMAHIVLLSNFFSSFSYSPIVWEESTLMPLHLILEDLHTAKSSGCEGEVFMCLVCCDLNDGYIICFLASFVILVWCYGPSHGFFGAFIYINGGKVTNTHQRLSFDLHRIAFISPRLYEWDRVHLYSDVYIKSKKIWAFSTHGPALFCGGSPLCRLCVWVSLSFMLFISFVHWFSS